MPLIQKNANISRPSDLENFLLELGYPSPPTEIRDLVLGLSATHPHPGPQLQPGSEVFGLRQNHPADFLGSPVCRWCIMGLTDFRHYVSQFP
jgi:hypothetical protein